jgi:hypothetical protein
MTPAVALARIASMQALVRQGRGLEYAKGERLVHAPARGREEPGLFYQLSQPAPVDAAQRCT